MDSRHQATEQKMLTLIRNAGGKLPLSDVTMLYRKTFHSFAPVPVSTKLSVWMRQFDRIQIDHNRKNNQTYIVERQSSSGKKDDDIETSTENQSFMEERILSVLSQTGNRIQLNHFSSYYRLKYNQDLLVPVGIKLSRWFQQFPSIDLEHDILSNLTFIVKRSSCEERVPTSSVAENVLKLIKDHDGSVGLSALVDLYQKKYSKELLLPIGKKISHWLCEHNYFVLTQRPSNNEIYVCIKHPVQRTIEESRLNQTKEQECGGEMQRMREEVMTDLPLPTNTISMLPPPGFASSLQNSQVMSYHSLRGDFEREFPPLAPISVANKGEMLDQQNASLESYDGSCPATSDRGGTLTAERNVGNDRSCVVSQILEHERKTFTNRSRFNLFDENAYAEGAPFAVQQVSGVDVGKSWHVIEEDQKESAIATATRHLGYSIMQERTSLDDLSDEGMSSMY